ncbi:MAG: triose-phosphate isomerase [Holosporales bacterium]|jgi:triosephosphate isomerase|nr:triose-phosphate isomerase [Holosporales bacterium]
MKKLIIANWKMNGNTELVRQFADILNNKNFVLAPPFPLISIAKYLNSNAIIAAQDCSIYNEKGAYTGEISAKILKESGAEYVILGHSERRKFFNESAEILNKKLTNAKNAGLEVIFCVSEAYEQQLKEVDNINNLIIAYEPVSAIGTGIIPAAEEVNSILGEIKLIAGSGIKTLYGGSVSSNNIADFFNLKNLDGVLVGGASLNRTEVEHMCNLLTDKVGSK